MNIRCKFECKSVEKYKEYQGKILYNAKFYPVTSGSEENKKFFEYTPSGNLEVSSISCEKFEPGKEYYLDISEVPEEIKDVPAEDECAEGSGS